MRTNQVLDFIEKRLLQIILMIIYYVITIRGLINFPPANFDCGNAYLGYNVIFIVLSFVITIVLVGRMILMGGYRRIEYFVLLVLIYLPVIFSFKIPGY